MLSKEYKHEYIHKQIKTETRTNATQILHKKHLPGLQGWAHFHPRTDVSFQWLSSKSVLQSKDFHEHLFSGCAYKKFQFQLSTGLNGKKINLILHLYLRGHPFMTSTKNNQFFWLPPLHNPQQWTINLFKNKKKNGNTWQIPRPSPTYLLHGRLSVWSL